MHIIELIQKKRDGFFLSKDQINFIVDGYTNDEIADYQMAAFLMAVCIKGMTEEETAYLTDAMLNSGEVIKHKNNSNDIIDKHSTGGVGDKISIPLAPAVASLGVRVPMIAGRGLGHTGGTLDKLESIPGFKTNLSIKEYQDQVEKIGCVIMGQTDQIAPADKKMYALRDVTGTVESIPLIASSIMSKKLTEGISGLVLDVKFGSGAFMKDFSKAKSLAQTMVDIGKNMGKKVTALMTSMNEPLGYKLGNALEIIESIDILKNQGPKDSTDLTIELGAEMLLLAKKVENLADGREKIKYTLESGLALNKFKEMVRAQGGDISYIDNPAKFTIGPNILDFTAKQNGFLRTIDTHALGVALGLLGGGRCKITDPIDHGVGLVMKAKIGDELKKGDSICQIFYRSNGFQEALENLEKSIIIGEEKPLKTHLVRERISNG